MSSGGGSRNWCVQILGFALVVHLIFCVQRVETKALPKRLDQIEDIGIRGFIRFHVERHSPASVAPLQRLLAETPANAVILYNGPARGTMELASALLSPRLFHTLVHTRGDEEDLFGRPLARGSEGVLVLVSDGKSLTLELR